MSLTKTSITVSVLGLVTLGVGGSLAKVGWDLVNTPSCPKGEFSEVFVQAAQTITSVETRGGRIEYIAVRQADGSACNYFFK